MVDGDVSAANGIKMWAKAPPLKASGRAGTALRENGPGPCNGGARLDAPRADALGRFSPTEGPDPRNLSLNEDGAPHRCPHGRPEEPPIAWTD
jgi:hypothetical protein